MTAPAGNRALAAVAAGQLAFGLAGQVLALRRRLPYDVPLVRMHGRPEQVLRDSWLSGTALSAPVDMLAVQAWAVVRVRAGRGAGARRLLGVLGVLMIAGQLAERTGPARLTRAGYDPWESAVVAGGLAGSAGMAALGLADLLGARRAGPALTAGLTARCSRAAAARPQRPGARLPRRAAGGRRR